MNLSALDAAYSGTGSEAYPPRLMLGIVLYEYLKGQLSPAKWFHDQNEGLTALKWLGLGITPSRTAWYDFRDRVGPLLEGFNADMTRQAHLDGLITGEMGTQDGTFVRACSSRHQLLNKSRLDCRIEELKSQIQRDQSPGYSNDPREVTPLPGWMARTTRGRRRQLRNLVQASPVLEARLAQNASRPKSERLAENKVKISVSDPEATLGRDKEKVFCPLYNVQYFVDSSTRLVLSYKVLSQATDAGTLLTMLDRTREVLGFYPKSVSADAGYVSILDLQACEQRGVILYAPYKENSFTEQNKRNKPAQQLGKDQFTWSAENQTYTCPQGFQMEVSKRDSVLRRDGERVRQTQYRCPAIHCQACPLSAQCCRNPLTGRTVKRLDGEEYITDLQTRMQTEIGKQHRKQRGSIIELPFADLKAHRNGRQLHGRGLKRAQAAIGLHIMAYNLMTLKRLRKDRPSAIVSKT